MRKISKETREAHRQYRREEAARLRETTTVNLSLPSTREDADWGCGNPMEYFQDFRVDLRDGYEPTVFVFDEIAGHWSTCHSLTAEKQAEIIAAAEAKIAPKAVAS